MSGAGCAFKQASLRSLPAALLALNLVACNKEVPVPPASRNVSQPAPSAAQKPSPTRARDEDPRKSVDAGLAARVKNAITAEPGINPNTINVVADGGKVTLFGTARNAVLRQKVTKVVTGVAGVTSVDNRLTVKSGS
jgi:hyperosmotically inducible periplasmic protein